MTEKRRASLATPLLIAAFVLLAILSLWQSWANRQADEQRAALLSSRLDQSTAQTDALIEQVERLGEDPVVDPDDIPNDVPDQGPQGIPGIQGPPGPPGPPGPDSPDPDDPDPNDPDPRNDRDPDDPESQDDETQEAEVQESEDQDPEIQDPEVQNPEEQDPEIDNPDPNDPDPDDPDPNSMLEFGINDQCNPQEGQAAQNINFRWVRGDGTITLVVECTVIDVPGGGGPQ